MPTVERALLIYGGCVALLGGVLFSVHITKVIWLAALFFENAGL